MGFGTLPQRGTVALSLLTCSCGFWHETGCWEWGTRGRGMLQNWNAVPSDTRPCGSSCLTWAITSSLASSTALMHRWHLPSCCRTRPWMGPRYLLGTQARCSQVSCRMFAPGSCWCWPCTVHDTPYMGPRHAQAKSPPLTR